MAYWGTLFGGTRVENDQNPFGRAGLHTGAVTLRGMGGVIFFKMGGISRALYVANCQMFMILIGSPGVGYVQNLYLLNDFRK